MTDEPVYLFLHRLALQMGRWDVDEMAAEIPMPVLWRWFAYWRIEPFGDEWRRSGRLASIVAAASGVRNAGDLEDKFMPGGGKFRDMNQTEIEMLQELRKIDALRQQIDSRR